MLKGYAENHRGVRCAGVAATVHKANGGMWSVVDLPALSATVKEQLAGRAGGVRGARLRKRVGPRG